LTKKLNQPLTLMSRRSTA